MGCLPPIWGQKRLISGALGQFGKVCDPDDSANTAFKMMYLCAKIGASVQKTDENEQMVLHKKQMVW